MIYGYISHDFNAMEEQKKAVNYYTKTHQVALDRWIIDDTDNKISWRYRALASFLEQDAQKGDEVIVYEASNLARSTSQIIELFGLAVEKQVTIHLVKYDDSFVGLDLIDSGAFLKLMHNIESDFVAKRTTEALARRRAKGLPLGRPKGRKNRTLKLDKYRKEIQRYLDLNVSKASIAKLIGCHAQTLYNYIELRGLKPEELQMASVEQKHPRLKSKAAA